MSCARSSIMQENEPVVIGKCEMPSTDISQENEHAIFIVKRQFVTYKFR
jgi:hypothetical protein